MIDGRVGPRTGTDERISLVHRVGARRGSVGLGKRHGLVSVWYREGLERCVLDDTSPRSFIRP